MSLNTNLVSYWKLDGNSNDAVGSNNGTDSSVTYNSGNGKIVQGAGVTGSTSGITVARNATLEAAEFSASAWFKVTSDFSNFIILAKNYTNTNTDPFMSYEIRTTSTTAIRYDGNQAGVASNVSFSVPTMVAGTFYHVAFTFSVGTLSMYFNGVLVGQQSRTAPTFTNNGAFMIGRDIAAGGTAGAVDEVGYWSRALTSSEINSLYNGGTGTSYQFDTTVYWVGGTGNWDASTTTHWSYSSGGSGGARVPDGTTNVIFDSNSGGGTTTISASAQCNSINFTGYTGTIAGSSTLSIYGSMTMVSGMTLTYTGAITFSSPLTGNTITTGTKTLSSALTFSGGGSYALQDNLTTTNVSISAGYLNLGSYTVTLTGTGTVWSSTTVKSGIIGGTSTIKITDASSSTKTFAGGGQTYGNIRLTGSGTGAYTISGSNVFTDFKVDTPPHTINFTAGTTQYVSTFTVNGTAGNLMTLQSTSGGNPWYLSKTTAGTISCDYLSLQDSHAL